MIMLQSIILQKRGIPDEHCKYAYINVSIMCRLEQTMVAFKTPQGKELISNGILYTEHPVRLEDRILVDGMTYTIKQLYGTRNCFGVFSFYKCMMI